MGLLAQVAVGVLAISFMTFVAFFGRLPALRHTPIAWLHRAIWVYIPNAVLALDRALTGGRITSSAGTFGHYVWYGRHPTVLIFYILLLGVGEFLYLPGAWPRLSRGHQVAGAIAIILPYVFLYLAAYSDPGVVTTSTHARYMSLYPYDFTLFHPGQECRSPLRVYQQLRGVREPAWFLLLLLSTALLATYGGTLGLRMISENARARSSVFALWKHPQQSWHHYFILLTYGIQFDVGVGSVTLLAIMTAPLVWGLLGYHTYLIYCGTTTNESMKWQDWQAEGWMMASRSGDVCPSRGTATPGFEASWTRWPVEPAQILVRTQDGETPNDASLAGEGSWERVWRLRDIENIYDIGFWDNLVDIFVPNHSFRAEPQADLERGKRPKKSKA
ncbi:hypothetical protein NUW58_g1877 [Xylaria curta]|uniref:Uncharacterized protein n=1 Tax=Xylaria curta TaxID=42375 RepID=A0ACC1PIT0_9PEZI|nr:hypothetical protein NUW58_g1877 [Xylaria curta]